METSGAPNDNVPKNSPALKLIILGAVAAGLLLLMAAAIGVFFAFGFIRRSIETTSLAIPLFAEQPVKNQIAFVGNDNNLWLISPNGDNLRSLTSDGRGYRFPTWSPDGRRLAFIGPGELTRAALYISSTRNSEPVPVYSKPGSIPFYLYWAPNSQSITFLTQEGNELTMRQIDTYNPETDRALGTGSPFYWVWSPQSDKILMHVGGSRATSPQAHISILENRQKAERIELKLAPGKFQAPVWSADGEYFYYIAANDDGLESIYQTNAKTLAQGVVTNLGGVALMVLAPDNRHIAYTQLERNLRIPFGQAYVVGTDGKNHRQIIDDLVASMYWSPDSTKLALLSFSVGAEGQTAKLAHGLAAPPPQTLQLRWWIYHVDDEELEPLISFSPTPAFIQTIPYYDQYHLSLTFWSPDSRYFVVTKDTPGQNGGAVWVVDTTGQQEPRQIGEGTLAVWSWQ